jgi:hypothetical protein
MYKQSLAYIAVILILGISCRKSPIDKDKIAMDALFSTLFYHDSLAINEQSYHGEFADTFIVIFNDTLFGSSKFEPKRERLTNNKGDVMKMTPYHLLSPNLEEYRTRFPHLVFYDSEKAKKLTNRFYGYSNDSVKEPSHIIVYIEGIYFAQDDYLQIWHTVDYPRFFFDTMTGCNAFIIENDTIQAMELNDIVHEQDVLRLKGY